MRRVYGLAVLTAAGLLFTSGCGRKSDVQASEPAAAESPTVAVVRATVENLARNMELTAEFRPYQEVDVMAKVAGYIKEIRVDVGDRVTEGQLLATLEIPEMADDLRHSNAGVKHSEAEVQRARDEVTRATSTHDMTHQYYLRLAAVAEKKPGLIAQQEIDDAQAKDAVSAAQVSAANSALAAARQQVDVDQTGSQRVQTLIDYQRVVAPFAGVVTKRYADKGSMIQAGTASQTQAMPVVRLSENSKLRLILPVPESAVPTVHVGQQVEVKVPTLHRSFPGTVARSVDKLSMQTRTMDTEVDVPNPGLVLIPGMYAQVDLTLETHHGAVAVPVMAVDAQGPVSGQVMVVTPNNRLELRKITLGLETADRFEVTSGLNEGDMVVLTGRAGLKAGMEVKPKITEMAVAGGQ